MSLPEAVRTQEERADAIVKQLQASKGEVVVVDDTVRKPTIVQEKEEVEKPPVVPEKVVPVDEDEAALEHKYKVLQGKYDKEMAQLRAELRQISGQSAATISRQNEMILDLHKEINLQAKEGDKPAASDTVEKEISTKPKTLDYKDFEGYGPEMKDLVDAANFALKQAEELKGKLAASKETEAERIVRERDREWKYFEDQLTAKNPGWLTKNNNPEFLSWLEGYDSPRDPFKRREKLQKFVDKRDAETCLKFFEDFDSSSGKSTPSNEGKPRKGDAVQPDRSASGADAPIPGNRDKSEVTAEQVEQAGRDYATKHISYSELEKITDAYQRGLAKKRG
jgi:hypothetical protein